MIFVNNQMHNSCATLILFVNVLSYNLKHRVKFDLKLKVNKSDLLYIRHGHCSCVIVGYTSRIYFDIAIISE